MKEYTKETLIDALVEIRKKGWIKTKRKNNDGGIGNTLEDLLGLKENNLPLPNASEWELKAQRKNTSSLITLFHTEPSPRAFKFIPSVLLPKYGWTHKEAGLKYSRNEKSFRQTINARMFSDRGFSIQVDKKEKKVIVVFDSSKVDVIKHKNWLNTVETRVGLKNLDPAPYWGFDDLFHIAGTKLHNCFFVQAVTKKIDGQEHFYYENIYMLKKLDLNHFIENIALGNIYIDFDARTGHNHGTKFRLKKDHLIDLYNEVTKF